MTTKRINSADSPVLEPQDLWYAGFKASGKLSEAELDKLTRQRYPTPEAFAKDMPRILQGLGFSKEKAAFLAEHIRVDPSRGAGHALLDAHEALTSVLLVLVGLHVVGVLVSSLLFGLAHGEQGLIGVFVVTLDALAWAGLRLHYKTLWASILAHGFNNTLGFITFFFMGPIYGLW